MLDNPFLAGLADKYPAAEIGTAAIMSCGFPIPLITRWSEASDVAKWLVSHGTRIEPALSTPDPKGERDE